MKSREYKCGQGKKVSKPVLIWQTHNTHKRSWLNLLVLIETNPWSIKVPRNDNVFHFTNLQTAAETQNAVLRSILEKDRKDRRPSATNAMIWSCEMHHLPKTCFLHNPQCVSVTDLGECDSRSNGDHIATEKKQQMPIKAGRNVCFTSSCQRSVRVGARITGRLESMHQTT